MRREWIIGGGEDKREEKERKREITLDMGLKKEKE